MSLLDCTESICRGDACLACGQEWHAEIDGRELIEVLDHKVDCTYVAALDLLVDA